MSFFESLRDKAVATITQVLDKKEEVKLTKDELFCKEYNLPDGETILSESAAEVGVKSSHNKDAYKNIPFPQGRVYATQHFLVFRDLFDHRNCCFTIHLLSVKKVERLPSRDYGFALTITTHSQISVTLYLIGLRSDSEKFAQTLKVILKKNLSNINKFQIFLKTCYSEYLLAKNQISNEKIDSPPNGGLGLEFKFPGNAKDSKDKSKMKLWFDLFRVDGRNLSLIKTPMFYKLVRVGLPNRLRGEIWELCCGSMYLRLADQTEYEKLLSQNMHKKSIAIEEIEKDLNRSLPEYSGYQSPIGIERLRRVLTAFSWKNPEIGYCQAMNIVVAALLIYMSEEQAFWTLNLLCDKIVPGYYSKTMYGTLLDQRVFESLVQSTLPMIWEHVEKNDIQLSVVSLPWFLSLYLTSMPLVFAFRIIDIFFLQGAKTLFQVGLAILKVNGEELLKTNDDGTFISIIKEYFNTLDQSAHPNSPNPKFRNITKFQELLVTAFKEFSIINDEMINKHRLKYRDSIFQNISSFVKRTEIRNLPKLANIDQATLSIIYDRFYAFVESYNVTLGSGSSLMDFKAFKRFMNDICDWIDNRDHQGAGVTTDDFLRRLFDNWDVEGAGFISLSDLVIGLNKLVEKDLMTSISNFFELYDVRKLGRIDREGILQVSEDLLCITSPWKDGILFDRITDGLISQTALNEQKKNPDFEGEIIIDRLKFEHQQIERYLSGASTFIQRAFEYAQPVEEEILIQDLVMDNKISHNAALNPNTPVFVNLPTFRMVVLADETYELFFSKTFRKSIHLDKPLDSKFDSIRNLRSMFDGLLADGRKVARVVRDRVDVAANNVLHNNEDNSSMKSSKSKVHEEEEERDDDFGVISINEADKDLLLGAEAQVLTDPVHPGSGANRDLKRLHQENGNVPDSERKDEKGEIKNLIEFDNS
ncbi:TBC-domain-containing protein [Suhomyces tanzawaensis NRRL Y-17324]|uniref:TBC-domain-containing protein n=1 Tax=Suhomyces tanzawaensis NRRL Y-17324 TaxID=984487 RepID=A0A1E4SBS9_9ASCO|nr:TBC-domain-containing protein [Suhomyces tanzawaensis NRRL Y-17324]ODV76990.1 TBC-domain-containing protein [Suhomyces tanzawaensis NRRL Y-17324]